MTDWAIRTDRLTRYFGRHAALRDLTLAVPRGCVYGFLGRNGSGKTTAIRMMLGLLEPTRGSAVTLGFPGDRLPPEALDRIGYLAEGHPVHRSMSLAECGRYESRFRPRWKDDLYQSILKEFKLDPGKRAGELSRGQRAILCLALTLASDPDLLVLDDPAIGLDPVARRDLLESMLYFVKREGRTIFFSSHLLADVERVAERIAILEGGLLKADCPLETFRERVRCLLLRFPGTPPPLPEIPGLLRTTRAENEVAVTIANYGDGARALLEALPGAAITEAPLSLEDAFISYVGERGEKSFFLGGRP